MPTPRRVRTPSPGLPPSKHQRSMSATPNLRVQLDKDHPNAQLPTRGSALAAGYDLYASQAATIKATGRAIIPTGIRIAVPQDCYGRVAPRSGLAAKHGIDVGAGVIDADYRGLLGVILFNHSDVDFQGDRIAQLILERITTPQVECVENLDATERGSGGFGSTGGFGAVPQADKSTTRVNKV